MSHSPEDLSQKNIDYNLREPISYKKRIYQSWSHVEPLNDWPEESTIYYKHVLYKQFKHFGNQRQDSDRFVIILYIHPAAIQLDLCMEMMTSAAEELLNHVQKGSGKSDLQ